MAANPTQIKNDIDNELGNKGYRGVRIINVISALKKTVDWVAAVVNANLSTWLRVDDSQPGGSNTDQLYHQGRLVIGRNNVDRSDAYVQAPSANFDAINGTPGDAFRTARFQTAPNDGSGPVRYYPFAELPASSVVTLDFADIEVTVKQWDNSSGKPTHIKLFVANRGVFFYEYWGTYLNNPGAAVEAYRQADGKIVLYLRLDHAFRMATVRMPSAHQAVFYYPTPGDVAVPSGVQVLDTSDVSSYVPLQRMSSNGLLTLMGGVETSMVVSAGQLPYAGAAAASITASFIEGSTDLCGTIRLQPGGNPPANAKLFSATFNQARPKGPRILLTAGSASAPGVLGTLYPSDVSGAGFSLSCNQALGANATYDINYLVIS